VDGWCRAVLTAEAKRVLRYGGGGWELPVAGNGHCLFLGVLKWLRLRSRTPLDLRMAVGAWMLRHRGVVLPWGMTVEAMVMVEHGLTMEGYVARLVDPEAEAHDDDESTGRRNYPQGNLLDLLCICR
jgi:hypothetical protein